MLLGHLIPIQVEMVCQHIVNVAGEGYALNFITLHSALIES